MLIPAVGDFFMSVFKPKSITDRDNLSEQASKLRAGISEGSRVVGSEEAPFTNSPDGLLGCGDASDALRLQRATRLLIDALLSPDNTKRTVKATKQKQMNK